MLRNLALLPTAIALSLSPAVCVGEPQEPTADRAIRVLETISRVLDSILRRSAAASVARELPLFNGRDLTGWKVSEFAGGGEVRVATLPESVSPVILIEPGATLSGITWVGGVAGLPAELPKDGYEIRLEFMKVEGSDFACGLTFPVADSHATLVLGGWGGAVVGLSSIDGKDASSNETTQYRSFTPNRWYRVRVRVALPRIEAWLDDEKLFSVDTTGKKISLRHGEIWRSAPLGIATYQTKGAVRAIVMQRLGPLRP